MKIQTLNQEQEKKVLDVGYDFDSQEKESVEICDLCAGTKFTVIGHHDRYYHKTYGLLCDCGNCFISPRLTEKSAKNLYAKYYRPLVSAFHGRNIDEISVQDDQKIYLKQLIEQFEMTGVNKKKIKNILDIGGSTGVMLNGLQQWTGNECQLLNIDPAEKETGQSVMKGIDTKIGLFENINFEKEKFDLILNCWAIDHLVSIKKSLDKVRTLMHTDSLFWCDFMDFRKIYLRKSSIEGALKIDHNYYLTDTVMEEYLSTSGLEIVRKFVAVDKWHVGYLCKKGDKKPLNLTKLYKEKEILYREIRTLNEKFDDQRFV